MSFTDEYLKALEEEKKKKKKNTSQSTQAKNTQNKKVTNASKTDDFTSAYLAALEEEKAKQDDIAPVAVSKSGRTYSGVGGKFGVNSKPTIVSISEDGIPRYASKEKKRTWFDNGVLDDGYQFGDITKGILGTGTDATTHIGAGFLGIGEKLADAGAMLGNATYQTTYMQQAMQDEIIYNAVTGKQTEGIVDRYLDEKERSDEATAEFVAKDLYNEEEIAKKIISAPMKKWTGIDSEKDSFFGDKTDALAQSGGQLIGQVAVSAIPGVGQSLAMGMMGATALGSEAESAFKQGATYDEALFSGLVSATAEVVTERIGGISFGGKTLTDKAVDLFSRKATTKLTRALVTSGKLTADGLAEGGEELLSGYMSALGQKLSYMEEKEIEELFNDDDKLESFIGGLVLGGTFSGVSTLASDTNISGMTKDEQSVIDKVYKDAVAEEEKGGKKLTSKEKNKIYDNVVESVQNGSLGIEVIEEALGGESYDAYKKATDENVALKNERDELNKIKAMELTGEQSDRLTELKGMNLDDTTNLDELGKKWKDDVYNRLSSDRKGQGSLLLESYRERARRGQAFEADLSQYEGKKREAVERAIKSGVLNNTNRSHELVDILSNIEADKGIIFDYTDNKKLKESGFAIGGKTINGFVKDGAITLNMQSSKAWESTVGHEITHVLEGTKVYSELQTSLFEYAKSKGEFDTRRADIVKLYEKVENADIDGELTAELVSDYLFNDKNFINHLTGNRTVFQKVWDEVKYLYKVATGKEKASIEKVMKEFDRAWKEIGKGVKSEGVKLSVSETKDGRIVAVVDSDILSNIDTTTWDKEKKETAKKAASNALKQFSGGIVVDGVTRKVNKQSRNEYTRSEYTEMLYRESPEVFADKMRASDIADDIVVATTNWNRDGGLTHPRKDSFVDFDHGTTLIMSGNAKYSAEVVVGITQNGEAVFYDVVDMIPTTFDIKEVETSTTATTQDAIGDIHEISTEDSLAPITENVNTSAKKTSQDMAKVKLSVSTDSNGNNLTPEQQEYFKDSKVVDENGKLKVMYHGSPNGDFTVFKSGTYFTENKEYADIYQNQSASSLGYKKTANNPSTYAVYLDIKKPFDTRNKTERDIFYNEYYRKWGTGTELMESGLPDWTDGQDLQEFLEENGYDYDGLILDEGATGGYGEEVKSRGLSYVIFNPEQVKNIDNKKPTSDPDIRFSLSNSVEETKDLIAVHNMRGVELEKSLALGGLPMPSIAIIKAESGHSEYGDVSLVFPKSTIDPKANRNNKVYGGDAWTPVYPKIEFKANAKTQKNIADTYYRMVEQYGYDEARPLYNYAENLEDALNDNKGEAALIERLENDTRLMQLYLLDSGKGKVADVMKETKTTLSKEDTDMYDYLASAMGKDVIQGITTPEGISAMIHRKEWWKQHGEAFENAYGKMLVDLYGFSQEQVENVSTSMRTGDYLNIIRKVHHYLNNGTETVKTEKDYQATEQAIKDAVDTNAYREWLNGLFKGAEEKSGIRNNAEYFTPSGNRRSWEALHWENNLENVIKVMKSEANGSGAFFGGQGIWAVSAKDFRSVDEIKADSNRLQRLPKEEYDKIKEDFGARLNEIAQSIMDKSERNQFIAMDNAMECIVDAIRVSKTKSGILNELKQYQHLTVTPTTVDDIVSLVSDIANMPTEYFEAKPQRAVGFDEVATAIIPDNASDELKAKLAENNIPFVEYESGNEQARLEALNSLEDAKFSLSNNGEQPSTKGTPLKDMYFEQDIAPIREDVAKNATTTPKAEAYIDDYAPITAEEAEAQSKESFEHMGDKDIPPEVEQQIDYVPDTISIDIKSLKQLSKALSENLPLTDGSSRKELENVIQDFSKGKITSKEELYTEVKKRFDTYYYKERSEELAQIKQSIRKMPIYVSDAIKSDFGKGKDGYYNFMRKHFGKLRFSKDGVSADRLYETLMNVYPDYFSADIWNDADRLRRIAEVVDTPTTEFIPQPVDERTLRDATDLIYDSVQEYKETVRLSNSLDMENAPIDESLAPPVGEDEEVVAPAVEAEANGEPITPKSTRIADGTRSEELLVESLVNYPMQTVEQKVAEKIRSVEAELADKRDLRREAENDYNNKIANLQKQYADKKDKTTLTAYNLLQSISRLEGLKARADADYAKRISDLEARLEKMKEPTYTRAMQKQAKMQEHAKFAEDLLGDTSTWKDKKLGLRYAVNTERRNLRDIVRDENGNVDIKKADAINDALNGQYNRDEAGKQRELAKIRKKYADLKITRAEDTYAQMLGEFRHNPKTTLTQEAIDEYYEENKNKIDVAKVEKVIEYARKDYDDLIVRLNEVLREQGMKEIPYRKGYFPHFTEPKQNFFQKLINWKVQDNEIPTSIAGLTEDFKPTKSWQSFDKTRYSDETDYSFTKGFDKYSEGALDWIYHIDTLQKRRAVENHIRFTHSDEGIQARIKEVYADENMDADEAQAQIDHILTEAENPLNNFVQDFMTHTNILANKKNSLDRTAEQMTNRKIYNVMQNVQNRTSANMVLANIRSALTNFIPITQSWAQVSPLRSLQATKDVIANAIKDDGMVDKSTFLTNRLREADKLYQSNWDKVLDKAGIMFEVIDNISSQVIWRSKYNQNIANHMTEEQAIANADQFAENVMAGRSKGNEPTIFNAKNPLVKAFTMFQLEVNNLYGYLFKDVPNDLKAETNHWKFNLAKGYTTAFVGAYVYNALLSKVTGSDAALDPIGIIEELLRDLGLFDDDEDDEKEFTEAMGNFGKNIVQEVPFIGGIAGGGRIPISSAFPYSSDYSGGLGQMGKDALSTLEAGYDTIVGNKADWSGAKNLGKELMNPILNVGFPVGGGQFKKTVQGLGMFNTDEEHPVMGSYTDSGKLRYPVEDTLGNRIQAGLFGQYANENAREYFDKGYAPLNEKQIQEYQDVELPIGDYWKYREGVKGLKTNGEKADFINSLDIEDWQKNILMNNILDRKEDVDMTNYDDYADYEEFDWSQKNPEKYDFFKANGISYSDYANADEDEKNAYNWAYNNPEKFVLSKAVTDDVITYRSYTDALFDIKADKDASGKTISGSAKAKKRNYIFNLDGLDYGQKAILYRSLYDSADDKAEFDEEIVNYINSRNDLTDEEKVTIYTELGFTVKDGYVYW